MSWYVLCFDVAGRVPMADGRLYVPVTPIRHLIKELEGRGGAVFGRNVGRDATALRSVAARRGRCRSQAVTQTESLVDRSAGDRWTAEEVGI